MRRAVSTGAHERHDSEPRHEGSARQGSRACQKAAACLVPEVPVHGARSAAWLNVAWLNVARVNAIVGNAAWHSKQSIVTAA